MSKPGGALTQVCLTVVVAVLVVGGLAPEMTEAAASPRSITDCKNDSQLQTDAARGGDYVVRCSGSIDLTKALVITHPFSLSAGGHAVSICGYRCTGTVAKYTDYRGRFMVVRADVTLTGLLLYGGALDGRDGKEGTDGGQSTGGAAGNGGNGQAGASEIPGGALALVSAGGRLTLHSDTIQDFYLYGGQGGEGGLGGAGCGCTGPSGNVSADAGRGGAGGLSGGADGGAIDVLSGGTLIADASKFIGNDASSGLGGLGGFGGDNGYPAAGNGGPGGDAGAARGGAIYNAGSATINGGSFLQNELYSDGGTGGLGGTPALGPSGQTDGRSGTGGLGGSAAPAEGGAIFNTGTLTINGASFSQNFAGSYGGGGGDGGGEASAGGAGGPGGAAGVAAGGAIFTSRKPKCLVARFSKNTVTAPGGAGGANGNTGVTSHPGKSGTTAGPTVYGAQVQKRC